MAGLLDRGAAALPRQMKAGAGRVLTYTRKSDGATFTPTGWVGDANFGREQKEPGASVVTGERDYLFATVDLAALGISPAKGDRITETIAGVAKTFELIPNVGEPVWRPADQARGMTRVHTKAVT